MASINPVTRGSGGLTFASLATVTVQSRYSRRTQATSWVSETGGKSAEGAVGILLVVFVIHRNYRRLLGRRLCPPKLSIRLASSRASRRAPAGAAIARRLPPLLARGGGGGGSAGSTSSSSESSSS